MTSTAFKYLLVLTLQIPYLSAWSQTPISGTVNVYAEVIAPGKCTNAIQVADPSLFSVGQAVLLITMQGGPMSQNNNDEFGRVASQTLNAGQYDRSTIAAINGNEISLAEDISGRHNYDEAVQLVGIAHYDSATVVGPLFPLPWNGTVGGVLALEVSGSLYLRADIDASGLGFRGGASVAATDVNCTVLSANSRYFYESGNWRGAPKGEGVIRWLGGKEYGRGPQANGGGGGNNHNSGGGGGSNVSAGGQGGENREPSFGGCDGFFPGLGGRPLPLAPEVIYLGGGGGAGHLNNDPRADGGHGGGIILIKAAEIVGAGGRILADGLDGDSVKGDGAGGGGAGGTIVLEVDRFIADSLLISARGGNGGQVDNLNNNRCMGPGGGGSGGRVISTIPVDADLTGGLPGQTIRSRSCGDSPNGATAGMDGVSEIGQLKVSPEPPTAPAILGLSPGAVLCPGQPYILTVTTSGDSLSYQWQADTGGQFTDLSDGAGIQGSRNDSLRIDSLQLSTNFRVRVSHSCFGMLTSDTIALELAAGGPPVALFDYELNGMQVSFENLSLQAESFAWKILELPAFQSSEPDPVYTFAEAGGYTVRLIVNNNCGADTIQTMITVGGAPVAAFRGERQGSECAPVTIQWRDASSGSFDQYQWSFPGGEPASSQDPNPLVVYEQAGKYDVTLTISGPLGESSLTKTGIIEVFAPPAPAFSYEMEELTVRFTNLSGDTSQQYVWTFGDGTSSQEVDPVHTFPEAGAYTVTLNAQNGHCGRTVSEILLVFPTAVQEAGWAKQLVIAPNPTHGPVRILTTDQRFYPMQVELRQADGSRLAHMNLRPGEPIPLDRYSAGVYLLGIRTPLGIVWRQVVRK